MNACPEWMSCLPPCCAGCHFTDQMLLPGRVFYIRRLQGAAYVAQRWEATNFLGSIPLAPDCIRDHRLFSYEKALAEPFVPS
mmetsp:Transcript_37982/g.95421  ORF Transcript_37982/g.95421 Transcript_37982/m.95421 type:complete len:82 (+) Transcript_37982:422-667(+)